jgi:hypothetical protein
VQLYCSETLFTDVSIAQQLEGINKGNSNPEGEQLTKSALRQAASNEVAGMRGLTSFVKAAPSVSGADTTPN